MFERFTERARHVVILAREEAKRLDHNAVGTEHILLGIIREGHGVASKVLESLSINPERVRAEIESAIGRGERTPHEEVAFTPRAKKVLELALDEARRLGHNYIGTEHFLLGLIGEGEGVAARVLEAMGADLERVRSQVVYLLVEEGHKGTVSCTGQPSGPAFPHDVGKTVVPPEMLKKPGPLTSEEYEAVRANVESGVRIAQTIAPIVERFDEIAKLLVEVQAHVERLRTELHTGLRGQFWHFTALVVVLGILTLGGVTAALFFRH